jgi:hypothetical protein
MARVNSIYVDKPWPPITNAAKPPHANPVRHASGEQHKYGANG